MTDKDSELAPRQAAAIRGLLADTVALHHGPTRQRRAPVILGAAGLVVTGIVSGGAISAAAFANTDVTPDPLRTFAPSHYLSQIAAFERGRTAADSIPAALPGYALDGVDADSARLIGSYDGDDLYLLRGNDQTPICLLLWPQDAASTDWSVACGGGLPLQIGKINGDNIIVDSQGTTRPPDWIIIDPNTSVEPHS